MHEDMPRVALLRPGYALKVRAVKSNGSTEWFACRVDRIQAGLRALQWHVVTCTKQWTSKLEGIAWVAQANSKESHEWPASHSPMTMMWSGGGLWYSFAGVEHDAGTIGPRQKHRHVNTNAAANKPPGFRTLSTSWTQMHTSWTMHCDREDHCWRPLHHKPQTETR